MMKTFKWQFKLMVNKVNFKTAFTAMMLMCVGYTVYNVLAYSTIDKTASIDSNFAYIFYSSNQLLPILVMLLPVIAVLPFSTIHTANKSLHSSPIYLTRLGVKQYYCSQALCSFAGSFLVIFIPLVTNIILNNIFFENTKFDGWNTYFAALTQISPKLLSQQTDYPNTIIWAKLFFENPVLYTLLSAFAVSFFIGIWGIFTYSISIWIERFAILSALPLEIVIFVGLQQSSEAEASISHTFINLNIMDYFTVNSLMGKNYFIPFIFSLILLMISMILIHIKRKGDQLE
ncbi:hypothetical protein [Ruminococcus sp.]